jgi:hypothetical protein
MLQRPSAAFSYDRSWEQIESMLVRAEEKQNQWVMRFHAAKKANNKIAMKECARNKKALEGVIKTLRWTLGERGIDNPLS